MINKVREPTLFGFYLTHDGRELLREMAPVLMQATGYREQIVASWIADDHATSEHEAIIEPIRKALSRWISNRPHSKLYARDRAKELRWLRRLEARMMRVPQTRRLLVSNAAESSVEEAGVGLANFFYGPNWVTDPEEIEALQRSIEGLRGSVELRGRFPGHYARSSEGRLHWFLRLPGKPFMIAHEFWYRRDWETKRTYLGGRNSGFAFPLRDSKTHRFLTNCENPSERIHDVIGPPSSAQDMPHWTGGIEVGSYSEIFRDFVYMSNAMSELQNDYISLAETHFGSGALVRNFMVESVDIDDDHLPEVMELIKKVRMEVKL